jgi:proteasome lid subunit RPN8/RPN11
MLGSPVGVTPDVLHISGDFIDAMRAHAAKAHPREACGVLAGPAYRHWVQDGITALEAALGARVTQ